MMPRRVEASAEDAASRFAAAAAGRSVSFTNVGRYPMRFAIEEHQPRPAASLLKLPVLMAVLDAGASGGLDLGRETAVSQLPRTRYPSIVNAFADRRSLSLRELCALCAATSDNPIATHLLQLVGRDGVASILDRLECRSTHLGASYSDHELGVDGRANVSTASDCLRIMSSIATEPAYAELMTWLANGLRKTRIPLRLPDDTPVANKTGTLEGVVNDAAVITGKANRMIIAFLCDGQDDVAFTGIDIGDCVADIWSALGEDIS